MTIVFIAAGLVCLLLLLVLYRNLPNKKVFYGFCIILALTIGAIAHSLFSYEPPQLPADESTIRRITAQQQIFDGWYTDYKKQLESLDYNWSQCQAIVKDYTNDDISLNTAYTRLNLLEHQAQAANDTLVKLSPPISLEDANYNLSSEILRKTQAYAQQQLTTITALKAAADPANITAGNHEEQARRLTETMIRNAPDVLFTAEETMDLRKKSYPAGEIIMEMYKTTAENGTASYEIQKSRFIAYTSHVETEAEAREFVTAIKKKHFDARHNCSAWVLGADSSQQKSNDDGEPGGTAGNPILEAIKQHGLTNVVVVVTRYFGGIKLGAGGLIRAYSHTASLGLEATPQLEVKPFCLIEAAMDYSLLGTVENWIRNEGLRTGETEYTDKVTVKLFIEPPQVDKISTELTNLTSALCTITVHEAEYMALPVQ